METVKVIKPPANWVRQTMESVGTNIGSVWFKKRENEELRKMCYRLHVTNPSVGKAPKAMSSAGSTFTSEYTAEGIKVVRFTDSKSVDERNNQIRVFDVNKVVYDKATGAKVGRGAYRTVPLENVVRICAKGTVYEICERA